MGRNNYKIRPEHRRAAIADEAARLIQDHGMTDFRSAKAKALERLGYGHAGPLPSNGEIEAALAARNRIFRADRHLQYLNDARAAAIGIMRPLESFDPRLVGAVLSGHTTDHSTIELHLFSDAAEFVGMHLDALGIAHRAVQHRCRLRHAQFEWYPGYRFDADGFEFATTVFPERRRGQPPLSPVDGRPMRRASLRQLLKEVSPTAG